MPPWGGGITAVLTTVDECVLGLEASFLLVLIRVEADDEDAVHRDEQGRQLGRIVAAVATVQWNLEQVLERPDGLRVDVYVVACTPARPTTYTHIIIVIIIRTLLHVLLSKLPNSVTPLPSSGLYTG